MTITGTKQLCLIQIAFPADDDKAIEVKKKIDTALTDIEDKRVELHLTPIARPPSGLTG